MTTFIDFRYAKKLSSALLAGYQPEEEAIYFDPIADNYIAFEFVWNASGKNLFELVGERGSVAYVSLEKDHSISFRLADGTIILKTPGGSLYDNGNNKHIFGFRFNQDIIGFRIQESTYENQNYIRIKDQKLFLKINKDNKTISVLGKGSGRAKRWAQLFYNRSRQNGLGIEIIMDWHHLRSGIPLNGTLTAEKLIELTDFQPKFKSYVIDKEESQITDFVKLFSSLKDPDVSLHITPPLYTRFNADTLNIGLFVSESKKIIPAIVNRCNMMDSIIAPTTFVSEVYKKSNVKKPIFIVPHGVDLEYYKPVSGRKPLPGGRRFNFLAVSTFVERKNIRHLVRAFLEEFRKNEDVSLFLLLRPEFGTTQNNVALEFDEWEKKYFRKSAPILLSTGYVTRENLRDFYANADTYVMPSNEGFGLTLLEAMASGTPVIALDYGGIKDFVNDNNGYLIPRGKSFISRDIDSIAYMGDQFFEPDIKKLRAAMRHVFENRKEAYKKGLQGRIDCEKNFTWDQTAVKIADVIEKTYEHKKRIPKIPDSYIEKNKNSSVSWVLCIPDDTTIKNSINFLNKKKAEGNEILCLFTRYSRFKDIMLARKNGFLYHRWDGSYSNCKAVIQNILLTPWVGILYPGEKINSKPEDLINFLVFQPKSVCEVKVRIPNGNYEVRFIRTQPSTEKPEQIICRDINIS